jgi:xylulokinase
LRWLRDTLGLKDRLDAYVHLSTLASETLPGADGLVFLPYLTGERTPHMDPLASGLFLGLRLHHSAGHLARAVMEGVTLALRECLLLVSESQPPEQIILSGGAARSPLWQQIQADIYNKPVERCWLDWVLACMRRLTKQRPCCPNRLSKSSRLQRTPVFTRNEVRFTGACTPS